jgi:hypothetical protein
MKKSKRVYKIFHDQIDRNELVYADFTCSLKSGYLLYGRLYITERHLCFTSNMILRSRKLCIAIGDIVSIRPFSGHGIRVYVRDSDSSSNGTHIQETVFGSFMPGKLLCPTSVLSAYVYTCSVISHDIVLQHGMISFYMKQHLT